MNKIKVFITFLLIIFIFCGLSNSIFAIDLSKQSDIRMNVDKYAIVDQNKENLALNISVGDSLAGNIQEDDLNTKIFVNTDYDLILEMTEHQYDNDLLNQAIYYELEYKNPEGGEHKDQWTPFSSPPNSIQYNYNSISSGITNLNIKAVFDPELIENFEEEWWRLSAEQEYNKIISLTISASQ